MKLSAIVTAAMILAAGAPVALAQEKPADAAPATEQAEAKALKAGDPAPALSIEKWLKGEPVKSFEPGKTYVVEFWATWCGPCIRAMPHLTELQKEYKDKGLTIIGVTTEDRRNTLGAVESFVEKQTDKIGYRMAWDKGNQTHAAYMEAAGQGGIPCSFVVDPKGKIAYIGHPMNLDEVLPRVIGGTWDYEKGPEEVEAAGQEVQKLQMEVVQTLQADAAAGVKKFEELQAKNPKAAEPIRFAVFYLLTTQGESKLAAPIGNKLVDRLVADGEAEGLNRIAWTIVDPAGNVKKKDVDLAFRAASEAVRLTESKDAAILDTLARVHFVKGDVARAIEMQQKAVNALPAEDKEAREELEKILKEYQEASKT